MKWAALDWLEALLYLLGGACIIGFSLCVFADVLSRELGRPWLWLQQFTTGFFAWGVFLGMALAARRNDHMYLAEIVKSMEGSKRRNIEVFSRLVVLVVAGILVVFGWTNMLNDMGSFRMPSLIPLGYYTVVVPIAGALVALFQIEQLVNGLKNGFADPDPPSNPDPALAGNVPDPAAPKPGRPVLRVLAWIAVAALALYIALNWRDGMLANNGVIITIMASLFLGLGYAGVPVVFSITGGVLVACALTRVSYGSIVGQLFHGIDAEALLAIPFFLLVGELMTAANVTTRMIVLAQAMVGHLRGGLAQVVTVFSIFFAGISGSSTADVAALARTIGPEMDKEGYDRAFTAALIASAATIANLIPPSIMAVVYGATGNVSIGGLFLAGVVPGLMVGVGLMIYSYFFGPPGIRRPRATFAQFSQATKDAALPLVIPIIIMGGILTGWFTPTEAGLVAVTYIVCFLIPILNRGHIKHIARDFANVGLMYSIPLAAVAAASAFGWMLAFLRGPDVVSGWISDIAGTNAVAILLLLVVLFVIVGDFVDAVPAIIIFMPILNALAALGDINPVHMGVTIITTLAFGLITPPYGITLLMSSKFIGVGFVASVVRSLPLYVVFFATILFCVFFPQAVLWLPKTLLPESVGCFKNPSGVGYICPKF